MELVKRLSDYAYKNGRDFNDAFNEMLDYFISAFDVKELAKHDYDYGSLFVAKREENPVLFLCLVDWITTMEEKIPLSVAYDFFGTMYEEFVKSRGKASSMGQFFTPQSISDLCAKITSEPDARTISDAACGSGRLLIAAWKVCDKSKFHYFVGEDIDPQSVKMCALNMMMNGMIGQVICHDSLTEPVTCRFGYEVNEVRYPVPTQGYSIRLLNQADYDRKRIKRMLDRKLSEPIEVAAPPKQEPEIAKQPFQMNLFNGLYS